MNICKEILKELPPIKVEIIPGDPKDELVGSNLDKLLLTLLMKKKRVGYKMTPTEGMKMQWIASTVFIVIQKNMSSMGNVLIVKESVYLHFLIRLTPI